MKKIYVRAVAKNLDSLWLLILDILGFTPRYTIAFEIVTADDDYDFYVWVPQSNLPFDFEENFADYKIRFGGIYHGKKRKTKKSKNAG